jgi:hypothetical protein
MELFVICRHNNSGPTLNLRAVNDKVTAKTLKLPLNYPFLQTRCLPGFPVASRAVFLSQSRAMPLR